jgi:hypothetical protein
MTEIDPFRIFRTTLFIALAVYTLLTTASTIWQVTIVLRGSDPDKRLLRTYLAYQLLSFRLRPLAGELVQIMFWITALLGLWWLHTKILG